MMHFMYVIPPTQWLIEHLGPKTILSRSYDGATPLHIASGKFCFPYQQWTLIIQTIFISSRIY